MSTCHFPFFMPFISDLSFMCSGRCLHSMYPSAPSGGALFPEEQETQNFIGLWQYKMKIPSGARSFILLISLGYGNGCHAWLHLILKAGESVVLSISLFSKASGYRTCLSFAWIAQPSEAVFYNIRFSHWLNIHIWQGIFLVKILKMYDVINCMLFNPEYLKYTMLYLA